MSDTKEMVLYNFTTKSDKDVTNGMLKLFYHAAAVNKIGIADHNGSLYLVGVDQQNEDGSWSFYPLAKVLGDEEANELAKEVND